LQRLNASVIKLGFQMRKLESSLSTLHTPMVSSLITFYQHHNDSQQLLDLSTSSRSPAL
jgi:hypothetical protein